MSARILDTSRAAKIDQGVSPSNSYLIPFLAIPFQRIKPRFYGSILPRTSYTHYHLALRFKSARRVPYRHMAHPFNSFSGSHQLPERKLEMAFPPNVNYYEPSKGGTPTYPLSNLVAFPSNLDGYKELGNSLYCIGHLDSPFLEHPSNASVIGNLPVDESPNLLPRSHVCPDDQVHHIQEKDTRLVFPCHSSCSNCFVVFPFLIPS